MWVEFESVYSCWGGFPIFAVNDVSSSQWPQQLLSDFSISCQNNFRFKASTLQQQLSSFTRTRVVLRFSDIAGGSWKLVVAWRKLFVSIQLCVEFNLDWRRPCMWAVHVPGSRIFQMFYSFLWLFTNLTSQLPMALIVFVSKEFRKSQVISTLQRVLAFKASGAKYLTETGGAESMNESDCSGKDSY